MAVAANCNISFEIDYTSSVPVTSATALCKYRVRNSGSAYFTHTINPVPSVGVPITLPGIQASNDYEFIVELTANGVTATKEGFFVVGKCSPPPCKKPTISRVYLGESDQIIMDYLVDETGLDTPEYQIATDVGFKNIIHLRVGFDYKSTEYIHMDDGNIPESTLLYMRARKHCSPSGVSEWSNIIEFRSGKWGVVKAPYSFADAYCVSGSFEDPTNVGASKTNVCWTDRNPFMKTINLTTPKPQVMESYVYLSDGITPAIPGNLSVFDTDEAAGGPNAGFNYRGIRWIRFGTYDQYRIYEVESSTGLIIKISDNFNCYS